MTPHSLFAPARRVGQGLLRTQADERLVDLARSGSEPAFEAIVARYRKSILRYCTRLVSEQRAEEAAQETFVRAYGALMRGEQVRTLKPWLYRIAHNSALNTVRARPIALVGLDERLESPETTELTAERREGLRDVFSAVQALPLRQRDAIVQRELEGRSYDEIAAALGVTHGAVRQLLNRARTSLRAGAAAVVAPFAPLARLLAGLGEAPAGRVVEVCGATAGGGVAAKLCATAAVTGVLAGGVAPATDPADGAPERPRAARPAAKAPVARVASVQATAVVRPTVQRVVASTAAVRKRDPEPEPQRKSRRPAQERERERAPREDRRDDYGSRPRDEGRSQNAEPRDHPPAQHDGPPRLDRPEPTKSVGAREQDFLR